MIEVSSPQAVGTASLTVNDGKIVSVELLEGNNELTAPEVIQYVNIQTNPAQHVDGTTITHVDRCGQKLRLKVKFDKGGVFSFKVKLEPDGGNVAYTPTEKTRNNNFNFSDGLTTSADCDGDGYIKFTTNNNGEKIIDADKIFVSPAGGDIFSISAKDGHGNEVVAKSKVKTCRLLYYVEAKMRGLTTIASLLSRFTNEYHKHGIEFKNFPSREIEPMSNIKPDNNDRADINLFQQKIQAGVNTPLPGSTGLPESVLKRSHTLIIAYTDHLALKKQANITSPPVTGGGRTPIRIDLDDAAGNVHPLWQNIITGEEWFIECSFLKNGGATTDKITITKDKCTPVNTIPGAPSDFLDCIEIDISSLPTDTGTITLKVFWVEYMAGGISMGNSGLVAICTKAYWEKLPDNTQNDVIIHEIGHQLGMVSDSGGILPDKPQYHYIEKGHNGNHCHNGLSVGLSSYTNMSASSTCVMFGEVNGRSAFCSECAPVMKKLDLTSPI